MVGGYEATQKQLHPAPRCTGWEDQGGPSSSEEPSVHLPRLQCELHPEHLSHFALFHFQTFANCWFSTLWEKVDDRDLLVWVGDSSYSRTGADRTAQEHVSRRNGAHSQAKAGLYKFSHLEYINDGVSHTTCHRRQLQRGEGEQSSLSGVCPRFDHSELRHSGRLIEAA